MLHKNLAVGEVHIVANWLYDDASERTGATGFVSGDIGKMAWQQDNDTFWVLKATTPTWAQIGGAGSLAGLSDWPSDVSATEVGYLNGVTSGIQGQIDGKAASGHNHTGVYEPVDATILRDADIGDTVAAQSHTHAYIPTSEKGANSGVATLDSGGKVPAAQLPSYVDDVLEVANYAALPGTGATGIIYVTVDDNKTFRWSGSAYVEVSPSIGTDLAYTAATRSLTSSTGTDVTLPVVTSGDAGLAPASGGGTANFLRADGTWAAPPGGGADALDELGDVVITSPSTGQVLKFNGTNWVNDTDATGGGGSGSSTFASRFLFMGA